LAKIIEKTLGDLLDEQAAVLGDHEAVVYPEFGIRWSYREFVRLCNQVAKGMMKLGMEKGHHVSIWANNQPEWILAQFATGKIGAVLITVNTNYRTRELEYLLKQSDTETLILMEGLVDRDYIEMLLEICPELATSEPGKLQSARLPKLKNVILLGKNREPGMFLWEDLVEMGREGSDEELRVRQASLNAHEVINMQYTSGTTGFPKGVMLSHHNIVNNGFNIAECMKLTKEDRLCIPVPLFHCFGCVIGTITSVCVGATMVPLTKFDAGLVLKTVEQEKCTALHGVPTMFIAELNHPNFNKTDFSSLRTGVMAGANCPIEVMRKVTQEMGIRELTICYGQTESSPVFTQTRTDDPIELRVSTVGKAHDVVEVKVIDPETGETLPPGVQGEICTRGYHVMKGYYKMPEATKEAIDEEGWLHTGDLGEYDENGYYKITGRLKDMIIRGGENIYPREIEEFIYEHPDVLDVQVVGAPDEYYGECVVAFIQKKEGAQLTAEDIKEYCRGKIARHKIPAHIRFVDQYPMTASGKVQKYKLREMIAQELKGLS
jgi:fatty-acyl-CoA synthase